jgi:hypothetical protein
VRPVKRQWIYPAICFALALILLCYVIWVARDFL